MMLVMAYESHDVEDYVFVVAVAEAEGPRVWVDWIDYSR